MPGSDGAQFIPEARARWPDIPIVAISGAAQIDGPKTSQFARDLGPDETLIKPFRPKPLAAAIERAMARRFP